MKFILGKKMGMSQVFRADGTVVPVTRVQAGPCVVTQVKTAKRDGVNAVQVGYGKQKMFRIAKPQQGHLKGLDAVHFTRDFRTDSEEHGLQRGDIFDVNIFETGEKVQVVGTSKGKGFQGVVKRHNFAGSPASHGHKDQLRMPGSIGATDAARVFKGTRMGGHMGSERVTVINLEIMEIDSEKNELLVKGAVPGGRGGLLMISTKEGKIEIKKEEPEVQIAEDTKEEVTTKTSTEEVKTETKTAEAPETKKEKSEEKKEEPKQEESKEEKK